MKLFFSTHEEAQKLRDSIVELVTERNAFKEQVEFMRGVISNKSELDVLRNKTAHLQIELKGAERRIEELEFELEDAKETVAADFEREATKALVRLTQDHTSAFNPDALTAAEMYEALRQEFSCRWDVYMKEIEENKRLRGEVERLKAEAALPQGEGV